jgi:hypothetical protein
LGDTQEEGEETKRGERGVLSYRVRKISLFVPFLSPVDAFLFKEESIYRLFY